MVYGHSQESIDGGATLEEMSSRVYKLNEEDNDDSFDDINISDDEDLPDGAYGSLADAMT